jgi:pilus assembly protein CpaB
MRRAQLIGIAIALGAGALAFIGMRTLLNKPAQMIVREEKVDTSLEVLVARADIALGQVASEAMFRWQEWPKDAVGPGFITKTAKPLIKAGSGGVLAAILPQGMRAVSTRIKEETAAGKLILPNDRVDVLVTRRGRGKTGQEEPHSETLLRNIRVLAIGQIIEAKEGKKAAEGATATLELTPLQAEELARANLGGEISLSLRSIADLRADLDPAPIAESKRKEQSDNSIRVLRYGTKSRQYSVN